MISLNNYRNADAAVIRLLHSLHLPVDEKSVIAELDRHPDYPSLLAVSDVLASLGIENAAFRAGFDELDRVATPFLAHINTADGDMAIVEKIKNDVFYFSETKNTNRRLPSAEFKKKYLGVVLAAEPSAGFVGGKRSDFLLDKLKPLALITGTLLVFASLFVLLPSFFAAISISSALLGLLKTIGLCVSIVLLIQSVDTNNPLVQVLCQTQGKTNCNAILSSKAAKVFEGLTWSEVGFFYFGGTWLLLLFGGQSPAIWLTLALLNFVSLPYTVYSIYYQARVAKQWCVLCCTVQALLWLEFLPFAIYVYNHTGLLSVDSLSGSEVWSGLSTIFICLLTPVILWLILKPLFLKLQQLPSLKQQLRTFKYNTELFNKMLTEQPKYASPDKEWSIVMGNPKADNVFTIVTNPYCQPCAKMHKLLEKFLDENTDIQARLVFTAQNNDKDLNTPISRHLMALNESCDKEVVKSALHDWYEQKQKNYEAWAKIYPVKLNEAEFYKLDKQKAWCSLAGISGTPTLLLNGYRLPELYQLPDLKYMLQ